MRIADFTDYDLIPEEHRAAVEACVENGLMNGTYDGSFNPNGNFTFAELCKIMSIMLNVSNDFSGGKLSQNFKGHWAAQYVEKCLELNIIHKRLDIININSYVTCDDTVTTLMNATFFLCNKINLNLENTFSALANTLHGEDGSKYATRSFLAYCLYIFYISIANKIFDACITESPNINCISVSYAEPILRFRFDKITAEILVLLISKYLCISSDGLTLVRQLLAYRDSELGKHKCTSTFVDHYTSLQTLKCLTEKDAHLRLYNAAFLNDPSEGVFFRTALQNFLDCRPQQPQADQLVELIDHTSKSTPFYPNSAYIVSFSNLNGEDDHNSLPMWFQYADHCKGCAIKFHTYQFRGNVYNVAYGVDGLDSFFKGFFEIFNSIWDSNPAKYTEDAIISIAADILNLVSYLYKNESYEHEQESRIILFSPPQNAKKEDAPRDGELLPRTYLEVPFSIDSVTFGPDVKYPERLAVAFASAGLTCPFRKSSIPFISK